MLIDPKEFAARLRSLRNKNGMSMRVMAEKIGVSLPTVQKWEGGGFLPEIENMLKLSRLFGIDMAALVEGETETLGKKPFEYPVVNYKSFWAWNNYSCDLNTELRQTLEEGKDVECYRALTESIAALPSSAEKTKMADVLFDLLFHAPQRADYPYIEPSDYSEIVALSKGTERLACYHGPSFKNRILGAIRGRFAGCMLGKTVEGVKQAELTSFLKETGNYPLNRYMLRSDLKKVDCDKYNFPFRNVLYVDDRPFMPNDDDTNYVVIGSQIVERFGRNFTSDNVAEQWIASQPQGAYCTAERVAYRNYIKDYRPPFTAIYQNPYREWIGAQIRADYWGYINPGDPMAAAEMAYRDARISHVKNGIYGEMFFAAVIAAAASVRSVRRALDLGLGTIPTTSRFYESVCKVMKEYDSGVSFADCMARVHTDYNEYNSHDWCHTLSNAEIVVACLLYGEEDYSKSICMAVEQGFDTDCNGATVGSVLGMLLGRLGIPAQWTEPLHDTLETTLIGMDKIPFQALVDRVMKHLPEETGKKGDKE